MNWKRRLRPLALASLLVGLTLPLASSVHAAPPTDAQLVGYFSFWSIYGRGYEVKSIVSSGAASRLTAINYAFANVVPADGVDPASGIVARLGDEWADYQRPYHDGASTVEGEPVVRPRQLLGNFQQLRALKARYPNLKVLISLGGWTWSKWFSDAALTDASRKTFVASCIDLFIKGNLPDPGWGGMGGSGAAAGVFDGIDVDWEYAAAPGREGNIYRPEDSHNLTLLLREFRAQLDAVRPGLLLTVIGPGAPVQYSKIELGQIHRYVDWINLMAYELHGTWEPTTNFQSGLYGGVSVAAAVQAYLKAGVPAHKLVLGVPFYGRGWTGVSAGNRGLYQPSSRGAARGTWEAGSEDYQALATRLAGGQFTRYWSETAMAPWLFDGTTFWTYDDRQSLCYKAWYIRKNNLGGAMFWQLAGDSADGALLAVLAEGLSRPGDAWAHAPCDDMN